tara:strand:- start:691 stop:1017 length:327 start_codon:yes stop_codon:yes gene_type:complete
MWLIARYSNGCGKGRIPLPEAVRNALVRWYIGQGARADEEAGIMLVQQARIGEKWIACDCLPPGEPPPILTQVEQCRRNTQGTRAGKYLILLGVGLGAKPDVLTTFCL